MAEPRLVAIEGDELVAEEPVALFVQTLPTEGLLGDPTGEIDAGSLLLGVALGVKGLDEGVECGITERQTGGIGHHLDIIIAQQAVTSPSMIGEPDSNHE